MEATWNKGGPSSRDRTHTCWGRSINKCLSHWPSQVIENRDNTPTLLEGNGMWICGGSSCRHCFWRIETTSYQMPFSAGRRWREGKNKAEEQTVQWEGCVSRKGQRRQLQISKRWYDEGTHTPKKWSSLYLLSVASRPCANCHFVLVR